MSRRCWLLAAAVLVLLAGCTAAPQPVPKRQAAEAAPTVRLWTFPFQRTETVVNGDSGPLLYDGRYYASPHHDDSTVVDTRTGKVVVRHRAAHRSDGWHVEDVFLTAGFAIAVDSDTEPPYAPKPWYVVTRYQLSDGKATPLALRPPVSTVDPEVTAGDGHYAYVTDRNGRGCVAVGEVSQVTAAVAYCSPAGWLPGFLGTDPTSVTFVENSERPSTTGQPAGCRRLVRLAFTGAVTRFSGSPCRQYAGASAGSWSAWSDASDTDSDVEHSPVVAAVAGTRQRVDDGMTGSLRTCDGWLYYNHRETPTSVEIRRWRPGSAVEVVYRSPGEELSATTTVSCADGWVSFMRQYTGSGAPHTDILATKPDV
ncbi:hypothetical protein [Fodinicola acaciae]|uniref:hypothetical protein n=1 Tax=Fodinicola acaciae TaxID=2681555 RepID=UPI0013D465B2|nr:hypothetical protein [Fodinicola acaciae]